MHVLIFLLRFHTTTTKTRTKVVHQGFIMLSFLESFMKIGF